MVRKRLYAKQTASVEYEQIDLFSLLEEEQRLFCFNVCSTGSAVFFRSVG
jgi:hypothetical protein